MSQENLWPYDPTFMPGNISHKGPNRPAPAAISDATKQAIKGKHYLGQTSGNVKQLQKLLSAQKAVAISLPVFFDPMAPTVSNNWVSPLGWAYGRVLDPPPTAVVKGGHCVCVTGFLADAGEPAGGHFVIRNSWSIDWGAQLPATGYAGPEPGYGQVSASYIERFLWEMGQL